MARHHRAASVGLLLLGLFLLYRFHSFFSTRPQAQSPRRASAPLAALQVDATSAATNAASASKALEEATRPPRAAHARSPPPLPPLPSASAAGVTADGWNGNILVALNKKVYRYVDERGYQCHGGGGCRFTTRRSEFDSADAVIDVLKDPRNTKPLDFKRKASQPVGVIISEQDEAKERNGAYSSNRYDFEIGYNRRTATVWRPFMCNELSRRTNVTIADALLPGPPRRRPPDWQGLKATEWAAQQNAVAAFVSNCVGWRLEYLRELRKHVRLDSFGSCANNDKSCPKNGPHKCDKILKAAGYKFIFAFENTHESHYVTEKVYTGLRSGAVPIYDGAPEVLQHVPGPRSIILAKDFPDATALGAHLKRLLANQSAYDEYFAWDLADFARRETVAQCPWQCRVCAHVAAMRAKGAAPKRGRASRMA